MMAGLAERAIADEWFAHFQYWLGSVLIDDRNEDVIFQFAEHSSDEYDHATELAVWLGKNSMDDRIPHAPYQMGGRKEYCGYIYPSGRTPESFIDDAMKGERCAIAFYTEFISRAHRVEGYGMGLGIILETILDKEKEHLADLEKLRKI
jgi:bacterioferritin